MKIAVAIIAHQLPEQLNLFIRQLLVDPEIDIYVHVNKRNEEIAGQILHSDRVFVTKKNIPVSWGSDGVLKAIIQLFREIAESSKEYGYVVICSGQDLIIKRGLNSFLQNANNMVFISGDGEDNSFSRAKLLHKWPSYYKRRLDSKFNPLRIARSIRFRLIIRFPWYARKRTSYDFSNVVFYHDLFWGAMPMAIMRYILQFIDDNPSFYEIYENSFIPEESFFTTVIMMSPYSNRIEFINGKSESLTYTAPIVNSHPPILKKNSIKEMEESGKFFARKFDIRVDREVIDHFFSMICSGGKQ